MPNRPARVAIHLLLLVTCVPKAGPATPEPGLFARNAIEVRFNAKNEIAKLIVVSELAYSDECALVVYIAEAQAEESVGQITLAPSSAEVGADVESGPSERRRQIDWRRNRTRIRRHFSGIRGHQRCLQHRQRGGRTK